MTEIIYDEDLGEVTFDGETIGFVWQLHGYNCRRIRSGTFRAWAVETVVGERNWFRSEQDAIDWLVEQV